MENKQIKQINSEAIEIVVDEGFEDILIKLYAKYGITRGDIEPMQLMRYDELVKSLSQLFGELITQNSDIKVN